jgi:type I restriction enzyme S subunit
LHNNSFKIVPDTFFLDRRYLFWWLQNPSFKETIINLASRTAQPDITHRLFNVQAITLPILSVQKEFVEKIEQFSTETQRLETIYRQKIAALNELKQSILQKAFTGELTADTPKTVKEELAA